MMQAIPGSIWKKLYQMPLQPDKVINKTIFLFLFNSYIRITSTIGLHPGGNNDSGSGSVSIGFMIQSIEKEKKLLEDKKILNTSEDGKSGKYIHFKDPMVPNYILFNHPGKQQNDNRGKLIVNRLVNFS